MYPDTTGSTSLVIPVSACPRDRACGMFSLEIMFMPGKTVGSPAIANPLVFSSQNTDTRNDNHFPSSVFLSDEDELVVSFLLRALLPVFTDGFT